MVAVQLLFFKPDKASEGIASELFLICSKLIKLIGFTPTMTALGQPFIILDTVNSTNNYAMGQVHAHLASHGAAYFARDQTAGKGQRNKNWKSEPGLNIALSVVLEPGQLAAHELFILSAFTSVATHAFFEKWAGDETRVKWPNDIYWRDRKAGGILIENLLKGQVLGASVAGIGININQTQFPSDLPNPVSLKQITGKDYDVVEMARSLCGILETWYQLYKSEGEDFILNRYRQVLYKRGEKVRLKKGSRSFECVVKSVTDDGKLVVLTGDLEEEFDFGEVEWKL